MPEGSGEEYLQRVGDFVAAALDPLGIDVQVDVETPGGQRTTVKPTVKPREADEKKEDEDAGPEAGRERSASPSDDEEWTVLADKKPDAEAVSIPIQVLDKEVAPVYPTLPTTEATTTTTPTETATQDQGAAGAASAPPAIAVHSDPRIQVALQAMMNMGFSNEGGWLANLLEAKDGDIGKVLDILQPVKK
jgi:sequestosome 1